MAPRSAHLELGGSEAQIPCGAASRVRLIRPTVDLVRRSHGVAGEVVAAGRGLRGVRDTAFATQPPHPAAEQEEDQREHDQAAGGDRDRQEQGCVCAHQ